MENISLLMQGFQSILTVSTLFYCLLGVTVGTIVGVLPGLGPAGAMAILFPMSLRIGTTNGIIMLAGIYFGAMYGGSTTSILLNVPGEAASMITCVDGNKMAKKGRAGAALAVCAIGSFVAGTMGVIVTTFFAPWLGRVSLHLGPPEYFAIMLCGLIVLANVTGGSVPKALLGVLLGFMLRTVGIDTLTGVTRFNFGVFELSKGFELTALLMGMFGITEVLDILLNPYSTKDLVKFRFRDLYPTKEEMKRSVMPILRGSLVGLPVGLLPCPSGMIASLLSYKLEKKVAKNPEEFGEGAIEGVAGPESANNSAATTGMIPLFSLGLPFTAITAVLMGALMVHGIIPGPMFITEQSQLFWAVIASFYIGNVFLLILNYPLVGVFASIAKVPPNIIMPVVTGLVFLGVYTVGNSVFDLWVALILGVLAFAMKQVGFGITPLIIGFVLGSNIERSFRQALVILNGNFLGIFSRPISAVFLVLALLVVLTQMIMYFYKGRVIEIPSDE